MTTTAKRGDSHAAKKKRGIPFPQYDFPGSKTSPFTGRPYTAAEAKGVHANTASAKKQSARIADRKGTKKSFDKTVGQRKKNLSIREKLMAFTHRNDSAAHRSDSRVEYAKSNPKSGLPGKKNSEQVARAARRRQAALKLKFSQKGR